MNKVILYIAASLDGFIADSEGGVDWLPQAEDSEDICGYRALLERIGMIVMGSRSYQQILTFGEWAWSDKHTVVFTSKSLTNDFPCIEFTGDSPEKFMKKTKIAKKNKDIWLLGGAELAKSFAKEDLIDEIILTIIPTKLGQGIALDIPLDDFSLSFEKPCMAGIVQQAYLRKPA